tara:strand:- start:4130 stop:4948 length:819 start_codon:yes stop_codon:yes gene_type:complete
MFTSSIAKSFYLKHLNKLEGHLDKNNEHGVAFLRKLLKKIECEYFPLPLNIYPDEKCWTDMILPRIWDLYMKHGSRSPEKVKYFHEWLQKTLEKYYFKKEDGYEVFMEKTVKSYDLTDKKNCDIVVNKNGSIVLIIPTKIVMTNYKQNKSNYFSNLIGELTTLVLANPGVKVVPLNIYFTQTPYLTDNAKKIKNFEKITYEKDLKNFDRLKIIDVSERGHAPLVLAYDVINYIFDIDHVCDVGKKFDKVPINIRFNADTPFRSFESIFKEIV